MGTIKLGAQELDDRPMNLHEAIFFLYIIEPYTSAMIAGMSESVLSMITSGLNAMKDRDTDDVTRMLAMLFHSDADTFVDSTIRGSDLLHALILAFEKNKIFDLLRAGMRLGII